MHTDRRSDRTGETLPCETCKNDLPLSTFAISGPHYLKKTGITVYYYAKNCHSCRNVATGRSKVARGPDAKTVDGMRFCIDCDCMVAEDKFPIAKVGKYKKPTGRRCQEHKRLRNIEMNIKREKLNRKPKTNEIPQTTNTNLLLSSRFSKYAQPGTD